MYLFLGNLVIESYIRTCFCVALGVCALNELGLYNWLDRVMDLSWSEFGHLGQLGL